MLLLVRICETKKDFKISEKISETTNSQTPIRTRDLRANDRVQRKLAEQFESLGYFYEPKKNQHEKELKERRLDNELLSQIYLAYYLDMPSEAKNQKVIVFDDKYDEIFDENVITASRMLVPYKVYLPLEKMKKQIQNKKRKKEQINEKEAFISRATFHMLNTVKIIAEKESLDLEKDEDINKAIIKAIEYITEVVTEQAGKKGELYTHDKFFKEIGTNKVIQDYVLGKYKNVDTSP